MSNSNELGKEPGNVNESEFNTNRTWPEVKAQEDPSGKSQYAYYALLELKPDLKVISARGTDGIYAYQDGIWEPVAEQVLREALSSYLGEDYSSGVRTAAEELIRAKWSVPREKFGTSAEKIAVENGLLDLHTRDLEPIKPEHYLTERLPVGYDPGATCPQFMAAIDRLLPEQEKQNKLQEFFGYIFWPNVSYKRGLMLLGETDTGKSTIGRVIDLLIRPDDIAHVSPKRLQDNQYAPANLEYKLVNFVDELDRHQLNRTEIIKEAISGDPMLAERKYKQPYRFTPTAKHIFASNKSLKVPRSDSAFWKRWITIVFEEQIPDDEQLPKDEMLARFEAEASGILNWSLDGLDRLREQNGFTNDRDIDETYKIWTEFGDEISEFMDLMIRQASDEVVFTGDLFDHYKLFCQSTGKECKLNQDQLTHEMRERGIGNYTQKWHPEDKQPKTAFEDIMIQDNHGLGGADRERDIS